MPLDLRLPAVFLPADPPREGRLALYGEGPDEIELALPTGRTVKRQTVPARLVPIGDALPELLALPRDGVDPALAAWATAATAGVGLIARGRLLPTATPMGYGAWRAGPLDPADVRWLAELTAAMPVHAHALPVSGAGPLRVRSPETLVRALWDAIADVIVRTAAAARVTSAPAFAAREPVETGVARWFAETDAALNASARTVLRVEPPDEPDEPFAGVLALRSVADPSLILDVADLWEAPAAVLDRLGEQAETDLLRALRRGARAWPPLAPVLRAATPVEVVLDDDAIADLLETGTEALGGAGIEVLWPAELLGEGPTLRATATTPAPASAARKTFGLTDLLEFHWQVTVGGEILTDEEVVALAEAKRPLVRLRGHWVRVDPELLEKLRRRRARRMTGVEALAATLTGTLSVDGETVEFRPDAPLAELAERIAGLSHEVQGHEVAPPEGLDATLRPYQRRGLAWLAQMCELGLGGCLADDMGLGKTVQLIALHLHRRELQAGPTLVICPTSLLGNWERELARFAPSVPVRRYHGGERHLDDVAGDEVVLVSYGVVRRDRPALAEIGWGLIVADEAQHAKNPLSRTARELRALSGPAAVRVALTGTPVENRLTELWSVLDWTTPGLLGRLEDFRSAVAVPVERYRDPDATAALSRLVRPFLLRRRKSDPGIAPELPAKIETDRVVPLTSEQATLYEAVVRETMAQIEESEGIARRGLVLGLLTALRQICNHPAQYLHQYGPLPRRSGKLAALDELLDVILDEGESVLVFSQYVQMGRLVQAHLAARGVPSLFLHGGLSARRREQMVADFQNGAAPVLLLSLKAGGVGLNLTRASHVIHYDRWWNPAVEDQATDRIGQRRTVQVHKLVTEGTVEDRIATLLSTKRELVDAVVGEGWITELSTADLADLVRLENSSPENWSPGSPSPGSPSPGSPS